MTSHCEFTPDYPRRARFVGVAALFALAALFVPRVICTLRTFVFSHAPEPFVLLLERPG